MGVPKGEARKKQDKRIFEEIVAEKFLNLIKDLNLHIQEAEQMPRMINSKISTYFNKIVKRQRQIILKAAREK